MKKIFVVIGLYSLILSACATGGRSPAVLGLVSLDEALIGATTDISSRLQEKTEIAIAGIETPLSDAAEFLSNELSSHLVANGQFIVLARGADLEALNIEHQFQMSGMVSDESAVGIGHYLGAKIILTGSFSRFDGFNQLRLRAIDVRTSKIITLYTALIRPDDAVLAKVLQSDNTKLVLINEKVLAHLNRSEDFIREKKYDEAIRELDQSLAINGDLAEAFFNRGFAYAFKGNFDQAIADYSAALSINPDFFVALNNRGYAYFSKGDMNRAIADYTNALRINPGYFRALITEELHLPAWETLTEP